MEMRNVNVDPYPRLLSAVRSPRDLAILALCVTVAATAIACAGGRPVSQSPVTVGPSRVFTAGYRNVRPLAELAALSCPSSCATPERCAIRRTSSATQPRRSS